MTLAALYYATRDGQARRIAARLASRLGERGFTLPPRDLAVAPPISELAAAGLLIIVAAVRYGRHLPEAERLLVACGALAVPPPLVFVSVNLTARKPGKQTVEGNRYLRTCISRHRLAPVLATAIAGRLEYQRYRWLDRQIIRLIMAMTGGPTDPSACIEFTDWDAVDDVAARVAAWLAATDGPP